MTATRFRVKDDFLSTKKKIFIKTTAFVCGSFKGEKEVFYLQTKTKQNNRK